MTEEEKNYVSELANSVDDFDLADGKYECWISGYVVEGLEANYEKLLKTFIDLNAAIKFAEGVYDNPSLYIKDIPEIIKVVAVSVISVVDVDGDSIDTGTKYERRIEIKR